MIIKLLRIFSSDKNLLNRRFEKEFFKAFRFRPKNTKLYRQAFLHRSVSQKGLQNNERLEFLGDSVLNLIISDYIYTRLPLQNEGMMTQLRSKITNREILNNISMHFGINEFLQYNKHIKNESDRISDIFGNALEAFIGALYLDKGYSFTRDYVIKRIILPSINMEETMQNESNYKGKLIEMAQKRTLELRMETDEFYQEKTKFYNVRVYIKDQLYGSAISKKKKKAEQKASMIAYNGFLDK